MKAKFVKFLNAAHFNNMNVGMYENSGGASIRGENIINNKSIGTRQFDSLEEAQQWWDDIPGISGGKLQNALDILDPIIKDD